ncbi:GspE/PulE family protein [Desulfatitalea alkaliphila]|uniref:GspE/PulE family protein n=1 Tax=Desulfatitalea alkaliphila TaxID=2929485 RepID=A0AA41UKB5_9BACT|nr:GspE/PulE family protein [Desulfatitalea alkaliphila]MCJ8502139.1 GspE/PulE family protein [Desulfatitalea alkaliphila]
MNETPKRKPIGVLLKEKGLISEGQIQFALQEQKVTKEILGELFERLGFVTQADLVGTLAEQSGVPFIDVDTLMPDPEVLKIFNKNICLNNTFLPVRREGNQIDVAAYFVSDDKLRQLIGRQTGLVPRMHIAERSKVVNAIHRFYYFLENPVEKLIETEINVLAQDAENARGMDQFIRLLLHLAIKLRATDIHIQPTRKTIKIGFRVDGVMVPVMSLPLQLGRLTASFKMKAQMDIAEQRLPQDGRFSATILNNPYDFRVSTTVSPQGENMVLRVLPMESTIMGMGQLGFFPEHIAMVERMFNEPFGIILLTGPTGSGKSTTLYAGIRRLNLLAKNVVTVEDPIEYDIPMIRQTQVNEKAGYNFANAIRYFLRHDPDVMLVGEIRDKDTAATAVTASTTGHLVLSTLHSNSAIGAIPRLRDLGIRPFLIADSLIGVVSQRLVRKVCEACKTAYAPSAREKRYLQQPRLDKLYKGKGCEVCGGSGYFGRTLVYELLTVDPGLAEMIDNDAETSMIKQRASSNGYVDIFDVTARKVTQGVTTVEEAIRVLGNIRQIGVAASDEAA